MVSAFIDDGYTRRSKIYGREKMYPDVTFTWRPATNQLRAGYNKYVLDTASREDSELRAAVCLAKHILEWDVKLNNGEVASITGEVLIKLHPELFNRLYGICIKMSEPPDEDLDGDWLGPAVNAAASNVSLEEYLEKN